MIGGQVLGLDCIGMIDDGLNHLSFELCWYNSRPLQMDYNIEIVVVAERQFQSAVVHFPLVHPKSTIMLMMSMMRQSVRLDHSRPTIQLALAI